MYGGFHDGPERTPGKNRHQHIERLSHLRFSAVCVDGLRKGLYGPRPERAAAMALLYGCSVEDLYYSVEESRRAAVKKENDLQCILRLLPKASDDTKKQVRQLLENA